MLFAVAELLASCYFSVVVFSALHGLQTRSSDENSVCLSGKRVICDKTKERYDHILIPHEGSFTLVL